jgi:HlyD family secretion protein
VDSLAQAEQAAESAIRAADFELAAAKAALISRGEASSGRDVRVTAPIAGLILRRVQESETVVAPGAPLIEIGTLDDLEIVSDLLSTDAVKVKPGAVVVIDRWGGEGQLAGRVQRVEPAGFLKISALGVEEQRVNVIIDFVDPRDRRASLGDGYRVEVRIVVWEQKDVLTTPTSSLFRTDGDWAVFVVDGDVVRRRPVKIGQRNEQAAEVLEGLTAGERVVAYPGESLGDGAKVRVR